MISGFLLLAFVGQILLLVVLLCIYFDDDDNNSGFAVAGFPDYTQVQLQNMVIMTAAI